MLVHTLTKEGGRTGQYTQNSAAIGTLSFTASAELGAVGAGIYVEGSEVTLAAGEAVHFEVTGAASAASQGICFIEYRDLPWQGHARPTTAPGDGAVAGNIINMLEV